MVMMMRRRRFRSKDGRPDQQWWNPQGRYLSCRHRLESLIVMREIFVFGPVPLFTFLADLHAAQTPSLSLICVFSPPL